MYLSLDKSCSQLLRMKCIILNSSPISREHSAQKIDTCSINYKIIQIPILLIKINCKNTKKSSLPFENLIKTNTQVSLLRNINIPKYKTKLQMPIANLIKNKTYKI